MKDLKIFSNRQLMFTALIVLILMIFSILAFYFINKNAGDSSTNVKISATTPINTITTSTTTPGYQIYSGSTISFEYPISATQTTNNDFTTLIHSINYSHNNPCDFKGDNSTLPKLTDLNISIAFLNKNLKDSVDQNEGNAYLTTNFYDAGGLKLSAGYIDTYILGNYKGYRITSSVEGCGKYTYYVPISANWTLVANRAIITEFNPIISSYKTNLAQPGIIPPDQEDAYFTHIMNSVVVK